MKRLAIAVLTLTLAAAGLALAQQHGHGAGHGTGHAMPDEDGRILVKMPDAMVERTLANMREHLVALQDIQSALSAGNHDAAGRIAEDRLGLSSLDAHGAHESAGYMPQGMLEAGGAMHRAASRFAIEAQNAGVTGDARPLFGAFSEILSGCNGCHAGYRLR